MFHVKQNVRLLSGYLLVLVYEAVITNICNMFEKVYRCDCCCAGHAGSEAAAANLGL
jgi:hypothetical protein